jgi:membrane-associated phospholipid phosphatase
MELSRSFPSIALSELLHLSYFAYLLLVPVIGARWYLTGHKRAFRELFFLVAGTAYGSYLFFILFPVDSPFYLQPPLGKPFDEYPVYQLVHLISGHGGARGGAFPSAHVSITAVVWLAALRNDRRLAGWLLPVTIGIFVATVYGRFHYVLDVFAGLTLALLAYGMFRLLSREMVDQLGVEEETESVP